MAATWADRRKLATLGARRGDWLCIGTSLDALGAGGASPPPAPTLQNLCSRALRGFQRAMAMADVSIGSFTGCLLSAVSREERDDNRRAAQRPRPTDQPLINRSSVGPEAG